ncbi:MAG TPA: SDR family oxidoreductase [Chloroflexota bacterium]|nr:SDR family oxidoreductase [Chloroflexota bacterium]
MSTVHPHEVVVVTGAGAGLGRAIVSEFAKHGAWLGLVGRDRERLEDARREIEGLGGRGLVIVGDVADPDVCETAAARAEGEFGPIDVWVNNAMVSVFSPVKEMQADEYRRVTEVTYLGYVYGTLAALHRMLPRDHGTIVQVGSALAYRSIPLQSAYCAAKHAIVGFTSSLRTELLHDSSNVKVSMVQMPAMNTPQFSWVLSRLPRKPQPVPPIFQPEVGARAVYDAAHRHPRELLVGWPTVKAVWGQKFFPGFLDHYLARTGYDSQQYDGAANPDRPNNLWNSVPGPFGAHGSFDARSRDRSSELWVTTHLSSLAVGLSALAGVVYLAVAGKQPLTWLERLVAGRRSRGLKALSRSLVKR